MDEPLVANPGLAGSSALCCDGRANYQGELFLRKRVITETILISSKQLQDSRLFHIAGLNTFNAWMSNILFKVDVCLVIRESGIKLLCCQVASTT
jgi:hypothetical protein